MTESSSRRRQERGNDLLQLAGNFISTFFVTILVIIAAFLVLVRLTGCYLFTIESASMSPACPVNSVVLVKPADFSELAVGDIVTYVLNESGTLVTHRIVSINSAGRTVTTQGDANDTPDASAVLYDNIVGRVVMCIPKAGVVLRVLTDEDNRPAVISAIVLLLGGSFLWDLRKRRREKGSTGENSVSAAKDAQAVSCAYPEEAAHSFREADIEEPPEEPYWDESEFWDDDV